MSFQGYTIYGLEHLLKNQGGLIVYYHAQFPIDVAYVISEVYLRTGRIVGGVSSRGAAEQINFLQKVSPFWKSYDSKISQG